MRERRWLWDESGIDDPSLIPDGIAELLTKKLTQLPAETVEALKIVSCIGLQIDESIITILDEANMLPCSVQKSLSLAISEGVMNKIGSHYTFSHDMLRLSAYSLIAPNEREYLHKRIGTTLAHNVELCALAVDQINMANVNGLLNPAERNWFARLNLEAGKHSIESSNFDQGNFPCVLAESNAYQYLMYLLSHMILLFSSQLL